MRSAPKERERISVAPFNPFRRDPIMNPKGENQGFTLIELLAVISIIAVLASIIFVGIQSSIRKADTTRSISNLRQVGVAVSLYTQDNKGALPNKKEGSNAMFVSRALMNPYLMYDNPAWFCPILQKAGASSYGSVADADMGRFVINYQLTLTNTGWARSGKLIRVLDIARPSQAMVMANITMGARGGFWDGYANLLFADGSVRRKIDNGAQIAPAPISSKAADPGPNVVSEYITLQPGKGLKGYDY